MKVYSFEKLACWQRTASCGQARPHKTAKDQSHFSNDLIIANDLNFLSNKGYLQGREKIEKQTLLIAGLRKYQSKSGFRSLLNFLNF